MNRGTTDQSRMDIEHRARLEALRKARDAYRAGPVISLDDMVAAAAVVPELVVHWQLFAKVLGAVNELLPTDGEGISQLVDHGLGQDETGRLTRCEHCCQVEPRHAAWCKHDSAG